MTVYNADAGENRRDDWGTPDWLYEWCSVVWGTLRSGRRGLGGASADGDL